MGLYAVRITTNNNTNNNSNNFKIFLALELNKIYNESCIQTLNSMPDNFIDLTVTSPPYNVDIKYNGYNDKISHLEYEKFCVEWIRLLYEKTKRGGRFCLNIPNILPPRWH